MFKRTEPPTPPHPTPHVGCPDLEAWRQTPTHGPGSGADKPNRPELGEVETRSSAFLQQNIFIKVSSGGSIGTHLPDISAEGQGSFLRLDLVGTVGGAIVSH